MWKLQGTMKVLFLLIHNKKVSNGRKKHYSFLQGSTSTWNLKNYFETPILNGI